MKTVHVATFACVLGSTSLAAADELPRSYEYTVDAELRDHPQNPRHDVYVDGDTLLVRVDASRLFPDTVLNGELGFPDDGAPPETLGVYVVSVGSGIDQSLRLEPQTCTAATLDTNLEVVAAKAVLQAAQTTAPGMSGPDPTTVANAQKAYDAAEVAAGVAFTTSPAGSMTCTKAHEWSVTPGYRGYVCGSDPLVKVIARATQWSLVKRSTTAVTCLQSYTFKARPAIDKITMELVDGTNAPKEIAVVHDRSNWSGTIPVTATTRFIKVTMTDAESHALTKRIVVQASPRDTHSLVRVQAEVLATNRLRAVSFAVAVTPVAREYFTEGTWGCVFGCLVSPLAILKITGDDHTVVEFGGGIGVNMVRAFQINGGFLFGTTDVNSAWRMERSWFLGIAIDPIILADVLTQSGKQ